MTDFHQLPNILPPLNTWGKDLEPSQETINSSLEKAQTIDLYIHQPLCSKGCVFCGLAVVISKSVEHQILWKEAIIREIHFWKSQINFPLKIGNLTLGGGTPNLVDINIWEEVLSELFEAFGRPLYDFRIEMDPRNTQTAWVEAMTKKGANSFEVGAQDSNDKVLRSLNRPQTWQQTRETILTLKAFNIQSIGVEFIQGLPGQDSHQLVDAGLEAISLGASKLVFFPWRIPPWQKSGLQALGHNQHPEESHLNEKLLEELSAHPELIPMPKHVYFTKSGPEAKLLTKNHMGHNLMGHFPKASSSFLGLGPSSISYLPEIAWQNTPIFDRYHLNSQRNGRPQVFRSCTPSSAQATELNIIHQKLVSPLSY